ncbi:MAG TPA: formyltransferase family protein [Thermoleophilaceae bacterium]|nr:formyltransferase family protein [Thermoleophilaceae bacterium]
MRCVYMGKHKRSAVGGLDHLLASGWEVAAVVAPAADDRAAETQRLDLAAERAGLPLLSDDDLYAAIEDPAGAAVDLTGIDAVFSFLFWKRIRQPLIELGAGGCLNFHPAPLPDMRGLGGYNVAILEDWPEWGVSAHFVDADFDTGDLVRVDRFPIDRRRETALSLDFRSQQKLLELFRWTADELAAGRDLPRAPQSDGRYVTRTEFEALRAVRLDDPPDLTARRIRAFWYPPHDGATLELDGQTVTLLDRALLAEAAEAYRDAGVQP